MRPRPSLIIFRFWWRIPDRARDARALCGARPHVEYGCELNGFKQDKTGVTRLRLARRGESDRVRYLVGTDGGRSFVRQALEIGFPGKTLGSEHASRTSG